MQLLVFRALWGMTGSLPEQLERIAAAGYDGIEDRPPEPGEVSRADFARLLERHGLKWIAGAFVADRKDLEPTLAALAEYGPMKIDLHGGRDSMTRAEGCAFFEEALRVEAKIGIPIGHETHRGRLLFTPWDTAFYLERFDALKIVADYSHWVNACERLPDDQADALARANARAVHIHGRVGYEEGPQVPDPSAPEYARHLAWHEQQWAAIKAHHLQAGAPFMTFTPEYGPPGYLHTLPHTHVPVADLWTVCLWSAARARSTLG